MPLSIPGEPVAKGIIQQVYDYVEVPRGQGHLKCQIPQRCPVPRHRYAPRSPSSDHVVTNGPCISRARQDSVTRIYSARLERSACDLERTSNHQRPKSSSNRNDGAVVANVTTSRSPTKTDAKKKNNMPPPKKAANVKKDFTPANKKVANEVVVVNNKAARPSITVPLQKRVPYTNHTAKPLKNSPSTELPDQETIKKREEQEEMMAGDSNSSQELDNINERDSIFSRTDPVAQLKVSWKERLDQYDSLKKELAEKQRALMQLYATLRNNYQQLTRLGERAQLPPADDLKIMSVSSDQLLQLCAAPEFAENTAIVATQGTQSKPPVLKNNLSIDMNKLYNIPTNLVATCEQTLMKRQEIIDWLTSLIKSDSKGIKMKNLVNKINEFSNENEMINSTLEKLKRDFLTDISEITDYLRKGINETMALELKSEQLTYELSEVNAQNDDLRKQLQALETMKSSHGNKTNQIKEELEKDLKEEKCKRTILRDRLTRAEGQLKMSSEKVSQLEAALEKSRTQVYSLERTVQMLHEQNKSLQEDFDKELNKLTKSIKENTDHLEEIADAREKLQAEKEELEKRLKELSYHYNESLSQVGNDMKTNIAKLVQAEKKCAEISEEKTKLEGQVESLCAKLLESELRHKDLQNIIKDNENALTAETLKVKAECMEAKQEVESVKAQIAQYKDTIKEQGENMERMELKLQEHLECDNRIRMEISKVEQEKQILINELENKKEQLQKQLNESTEKITSYVNQIDSLRGTIAQIQQDLGDVESLDELKQLVNEQRSKLQEVTLKNNELLEELRSKNYYIDQQRENLETHLQHLEQKDDIIKMLSEKEEEHANIIKLLRNNMEIRANVENDLNQKLADKDAYIESLVTNLDTRKEQISQLEKIVLTLEEQIQTANLRGREESEKVESLQKKILEYESLYLDNQNGEPQVDNIDSLIKILEQELGSPYEQYLEKEADLLMPRQKGDLGKKKTSDVLKRSGANPLTHQTEPKKIQAYYTDQGKPTKLNGGNLMKKSFVTKDQGEKLEGNSDKYSMFNLYDGLPEPPQMKDRVNESPSRQNDLKYVKRKPYSIPPKVSDDKQSKMFKFAGHRL